MSLPAAAAAPLADRATRGTLSTLHHAFTDGITVGSITVTLGGLAAAVVIVIAAIILSRILRAGLKRYGIQHASSDSAVYTLSRVLHYAILVLGIWAALAVMGIPLTRLALFAGALGVGIGFGLQAIFSNFIAGLILLFDRSLKVGDFIQLGSGVQGEVRDIHIRATRITTTDGIDILIPNSKFMTENVVNLTWRDASRRQHIPFGVAYDTDKETVRKAALEAAAAVPFTLTDDPGRQPLVWLTGFGDSALEFELLVWLRPDAARRDVNATYRWALHDALEKYGVEMPFPQRDLHVRSWPGLDGAAARRDRHARANEGGDAHRHGTHDALHRTAGATTRAATRAGEDSGTAALPSTELKGRQAHGQDH